ncbi:Laccase-1 [Eumeta japonica]|uniref:Laccase-1 n=1 Tax=Eumeta variegata TaxID=151549 RepID=A0A4C1Z4H4_EUMVA|nr:Laccase-1 [Eumeta japonica]
MNISHVLVHEFMSIYYALAGWSGNRERRDERTKRKRGKEKEHVMIVTDWVHELSIAMFSSHHHSYGDNKPPTLLINGLGRFHVFNSTTGATYMRAARFNVEQGFRYRFRVINAEFLNCPIEMSFDGHNITVIASDGHDLVPITGEH